MKSQQRVRVKASPKARAMGTVWKSERVRLMCYTRGPRVGGSTLWAEVRYFVDGSKAHLIKQGWVPDSALKTGTTGRVRGVPYGKCAAPITKPRPVKKGAPNLPPPPPKNPPVESIPRALPIFDCGFFVCDAYLQRSPTRYIANRLEPLGDASAVAVGGAAGAACLATGVGAPVAGVCTAVGTLYGHIAVKQFTSARNQNACLMVRFAAPTNPVKFPPVIFVRNNGFCHD